VSTIFGIVVAPSAHYDAAIIASYSRRRSSYYFTDAGTAPNMLTSGEISHFEFHPLEDSAHQQSNSELRADPIPLADRFDDGARCEVVEVACGGGNTRLTEVASDNYTLA